jgi:hypothetical protein
MQIAIASLFVVVTFVVLYWLINAPRPWHLRNSKHGFPGRARRLIRIAIERAAHRDVHCLIAQQRERHL